MFHDFKTELPGGREGLNYFLLPERGGGGGNRVITVRHKLGHSRFYLNNKIRK